MNDTNNTNGTNNRDYTSNVNNANTTGNASDAGVNFTMSGNPYNPDESQRAAQTNNASAESYSQSYNPYSQASAAGQPNANQSYANQPYSNQAYNSGTNNNAYGGASAGSTDNSYSRMNMNGQAYQQAAKPKKQRAPRKPGAFGPFAAKTVAGSSYSRALSERRFHRSKLYWHESYFKFFYCKCKAYHYNIRWD